MVVRNWIQSAGGRDENRHLSTARFGYLWARTAERKQPPETNSKRMIGLHAGIATMIRVDPSSNSMTNVAGSPKCLRSSLT